MLGAGQRIEARPARDAVGKLLALILPSPQTAYSEPIGQLDVATLVSSQISSF